MHRSELTVDLGAIRRNARTLLRALEGSQLWAVVKANAYGHGAVDVAAAVVDEGAGALCVATVPEALELRHEFPLARVLVMGPVSSSPSGRTISPKASASTSSWTPEWGAGDSPSCRSPGPRWSA
jgi:alanine racemase